MVERRLTPQDIHDRYRVLDGAIYGLASHGRFNGAFKPANRSPDVEAALPRGRRRAPGPGHADGDDVGLDRRRHPRSGRSRRTCSRADLAFRGGTEPRRHRLIAFHSGTDSNRRRDAR